MTTTTTTAINIEAFYSADELVLTSKRTGNKIVIDRKRVGDGKNLTDDEYREYLSTIDEGLPNRNYSVEYTPEQFTLIKSIGKQCGRFLRADGTANVPTPPPTQPAPTPVHNPIIVESPTIAQDETPAVVIQPAPVPESRPLTPQEEYQRELAQRQARVEEERLRRIVALDALRAAGNKAANDAIKTTAERISRHNARGAGITLIERINRLSTEVRNLDGVDFYQIEYDIPDEIQRWCPNPAHWLWRYACHLGLSKWTITKAKMECQDVVDFFARCRVWGATLNVFQLHENERAHILELARESLRTLLIEANTTLIQGIAKLDQELNEFCGAETQEMYEKRQDKRDNQVRAKIKTVAERMENAICAAETYDSSEDIADLIRGLKEIIAGQQAAFNVRMADRQKAERLFVSVV